MTNKRDGKPSADASGVSRRTFLKVLSAASGTAAVAVGCGGAGKLNPLPLAVYDPELPAGEPVWTSGFCSLCPGGCGMRFKVVDGNLVKVEGDPAHPVSRGGLCARGQASPQVVYHPDRLQGPVRREGGGETHVSWEEATASIAEAIRSLVSRGGADRIGILAGDPRGHRRIAAERFLAALGSPHLYLHDPFSEAPLVEAWKRTTGLRGGPAVDLERCSFFLGFGGSWLEGSRNPVAFLRDRAAMRSSRGGKWAQVEPRYSLTAANADEWVPCRPGTEGILALGIASVILEEGLEDRSFLEDRCAGADDYRALASGYGPRRIEQITGVPAATVRRLAVEFASSGASIALAGTLSCGHANALGACEAILSLNALAGTLGGRNGLHAAATVPFAAHAPSLAAPAPRSGSDLLAALEQDRLDLLLVWGVDAALTLPGFAEAAEDRVAIVDLSVLPGDTAALARWSLPEAADGECWNDDIPSASGGRAVATLQRPALTSVRDARGGIDVLLALAREAGGDLADSFPWEDSEAFLRQGWRGVHESGAGSVTAARFESFWERAVEAGGWWADTGTPGPTGPFRLPSRPPEDPAWQGDPDAYPLHLVVCPGGALLDGRTAPLPALQELPDPMTGVMWDSWVELDPGTADRLGLKDGEDVVVGTPRGEATLPLRVTAGLLPGCACIPAGRGHRGGGRYASGRGVNPFGLLVPDAEPVTGGPATQTTRAWMRRS